VKGPSVNLRRVADNISIHPLLATEVFLGPIKEGPVDRSVRPHVAVKDLSVLLSRVEDNVSAHPLLATEVFLGITKGGIVVVALGSEAPAFS
jgi:hypothetical protein